MDDGLLIRNGIVVDGTGNPWFKADVGIRADKIDGVGALGSFKAERTIDATGLVVTPGFIDIHSHADFVFPLREHPERMSSKIRQGVTTEVVGQCGFSAAPVSTKHFDEVKHFLATIADVEKLEWTWTGFKGFFDLLDRQGIAQNVASLVGHATVRIGVMGWDYREPTEDETQEMRRLIAQAMQEGAVGLSLGLLYPPDEWYDTDWYVEMCKVVAECKGFCAVHQRADAELNLESGQEVLVMGEKSGASMQLSHSGILGPENWKLMPRLLQMKTEARERGIDFTFDMFPYVLNPGAPCVLLAMFPPWSVKEGYPGLRGLLKDPQSRKKVWDYIEDYKPSWPPAWACNFPKAAGYERLHVMGFKQEKNRQYDTKSIAEIGRMMGKEPFDAISDLVVEGEEPTCAIAALSGDLLTPTDEPLRQMARHPLAMFGSDGVPGVTGVTGIWNPHSYGTFPKVVGRFVREKVLTLEEAVRKSTSLPAWRLGCRHRGLIREGMYADIVIFDKSKLIDTALDFRPDPVRHDYPEGIHYVLVNGRIVVENGEQHTKVLAGHVLRRKNGVVEN